MIDYLFLANLKSLLYYIAKTISPIAYVFKQFSSNVLLKSIPDLVDHRLEVAKELGAETTLKVKSDSNEVEISEQVIKLLGSRPQITIDCSGFQSTIRLAMEVKAQTEI